MPSPDALPGLADRAASPAGVANPRYDPDMTGSASAAGAADVQRVRPRALLARYASRHETQGETAVFGACDVRRCRARQIRRKARLHQPAFSFRRLRRRSLR